MRLPNFLNRITQKIVSPPRNLAHNFWRIANIALHKGKLAIPPLFNVMGLGCCLLHMIKQNCLRENFHGNCNRDDSGISLLEFSSKTNLKLHDIN